MSDNVKNGIRYGCHVDLVEGQKPDDCVLDYGCATDCVYGTLKSGRIRRSKWTCQYWRSIKKDAKQ